MGKLHHLILASAVACLGLSGVAVACPSLVRDLGFDVWNLRELKRDLVEADRVTETLAAKGEAVGDRAKLRTLLIEKYISGRLTFNEAVRESTALDQEWPDVAEIIVMYYPASDLVQSEAMHLRRLLWQRAGRGGCQSPWALARLERDYGKFLNRED